VRVRISRPQLDRLGEIGNGGFRFEYGKVRPPAY
jgi:hypothetical protein